MWYLAIIIYYAYARPIRAIWSEYTPIEQTGEILLWLMNLGFVIFEALEVKEVGVKKYINLKNQNYANIFDISISLLWFVLFVFRVVFFFMELDFEEGSATDGQQAYLFLFAFQILLLTIRSLFLFLNSRYLGTMVRAIKLMFAEIVKFLVILTITLFGFLFGLWFLIAANDCNSTNPEDEDDCDQDFEGQNLGRTLKYMFQVFIGTGDLGGVVDQGIGIWFMLLVTVLGTLVLNNLLIALMTTQYENVQEDAKKFVIYNQVETTYDLIRRGRAMPPPLNILVCCDFLLWKTCVFTLFLSSLSLIARVHVHSRCFQSGSSYIHGVSCSSFAASAVL